MGIKPVQSLTILLLAGTLCVTEEARALASDREQPIHIQADAATIDDSSGSSLYTGNVIIEQGTLQINADEVEIISHEREVIQIVASTNPGSSNLAHYEQLPDDSEDRVYANARTITYLVKEEKLHLTGNATLKQMQDTFAGERLFYDVSQGILNLSSGDKPGDRIRMTINPRAR